MDGTFSGHHLGVLAVVLATGIAITAWWVLSGRPEQQSVPSVTCLPSESTSWMYGVGPPRRAGSGAIPGPPRRKPKPSPRGSSA